MTFEKKYVAILHFIVNEIDTYISANNIKIIKKIKICGIYYDVPFYNISFLSWDRPIYACMISGCTIMSFIRLDIFSNIRFTLRSGDN